MEKDLVRNHLRKGMTRKEVVKMLGKPDAEVSRAPLRFLMYRAGAIGEPIIRELRYVSVGLDSRGRVRKIHPAP